MAFRWLADDDPTLNAGLVVFENFRGSGPVLLRNSMFFVIFQVVGGGGGPDPLPPLWIRAWDRTMSRLIEIY